MDPLTQASLGAAVAVAFSGRENVRLAALVGAVAGAAPDLDVLIRSAEDPLLSLQYHRHFTHSLIFAPVIGLLVAGLFWCICFRRRPAFALLARFGVLAALTHGPLDACTSYGTLLYWPFSWHRESWDLISIIDPIFTGPLVALLVVAFFRRRVFYGRLAVTLCCLYFALGWVQRERAAHYAEELAALRGHGVAELTARPSFANIVLWRTIYRDGDTYHVDAVQLGPLGGHRLYEGAQVEALTADSQAELATEGSVLAGDLERFRFFSQGYVYAHPGEMDVIGDLRYAIHPDSIIPLWGIRYDATLPGEHVQMGYFRVLGEDSFSRLWDMILGR
ncbi:MAG: metal-dependent hydrolase [Verrucomicrobiota bacterium]